MTREFKHPERIRLGVIGCGPITLNAHADAIAKAGNILLHAIADRDETLLAALSSRLRPARTYRDGEELLNDPRVDLVLIAVHDRFHVPLARKAWRPANMCSLKNHWGSRLRNANSCGTSSPGTGSLPWDVTGDSCLGCVPRSSSWPRRAAR